MASDELCWAEGAMEELKRVLFALHHHHRQADASASTFTKLSSIKTSQDPNPDSFSASPRSGSSGGGDDGTLPVVPACLPEARGQCLHLQVQVLPPGPLASSATRGARGRQPLGGRSSSP